MNHLNIWHNITASTKLRTKDNSEENGFANLLLNTSWDLWQDLHFGCQVLDLSLYVEK